MFTLSYVNTVLNQSANAILYYVAFVNPEH